ncbi:unnamed protein product [Brassica rapa]|uniref:Uncharacterized protein n=2 Tax=Brassica TaxID=3705 RepID=A0A8D9GRM6_BRACM|nr:unnamed protein product [Brassica napus]CAG7885542.1 unnamed protein product [Brassica rapa]
MKRGGELIGLDTLLLEAKVVLFSKLIIIVTTLNVHRLTTYRNMYSLGGFDVPRCNQNYRLYDSPFLIQFSDSPTELVLPILQQGYQSYGYLQNCQNQKYLSSSNSSKCESLHCEYIKFLEFKPSVKFRGCISLCNLIIAPSTSLKSEVLSFIQKHIFLLF